VLLALSQPVDSCKHTIVSILKARFENIPESLTETFENLEYSSGYPIAFKTQNLKLKTQNFP
jgi:hypothetical protein